MSRYTLPPRQKMINLIYIILIAMLAIYVSKTAIKGYDIMSTDYRPQIAQLQDYNEELRKRVILENPDSRALVEDVKGKTSSIQQELNDLKENIRQQADKDDYQNGVLKNGDDEIATSAVLLKNEKGTNLKNKVSAYKEEMSGLVDGDMQKALINSYLNVDSQTDGKSWEENTFSNMTANAGVAVLDKMEVEALNCEKEVLISLLKGGFSKTPEEEKVVTEEAKTVGGNQILVNGMPTDIQEDGTLDIPMVQMNQTATEVLYKSYENELELTSIGVDETSLQVSMKNGKITKHGNLYAAVPNSNSQTAEITVSNGERILAHYEYKVKNLPTPQPYIAYTNNDKDALYKGNVPISKSALNDMKGLVARTSDGPQVDYKVVSFETVFIETGSDKVTTLKNEGNKFSAEQKEYIDKLRAGDKFYITSITVSGGQKTNEQIGSINVVIY